LGGEKAIIATVTSANGMQAISGGLGVNETLMVIGVVSALTINSLDLLAKRASVKGWYSEPPTPKTPFCLVCSTV
jgi:alcohol dehydrogenase